MTTAIRSVAGIYLTVITLTGTTFNGLVVIVLLKNIASISVPNVFILSICTSGLLASCIAVPQALYSVTVGSWEETSCEVHAFLIYLFGTVSMLTLGAVALEKYLTIVKYTYANGNFLSRKQAVFLVIAMWLFSFLLSALPFAGWSRYGVEAANVTCSLRWDQTEASDVSYFVVMFLGCFVLPVSVMVFSYYKIFMVRRKVGQVSTRFATNLSNHAKQELQKEIKTAVQLLVLILSYLLAWTPYSVVVILVISGVRETSGVLLLVASLFAKASFTYNPVLYAFISKTFRERFVELFCRRLLLNNRIGPI